MRTPPWAVGMQRLGPGIYVDDAKQLHLHLAAILEAAHVQPTEENIRILAEAATQTARQEFGPDTPISEVQK